jgi:hypothetical protein
MAFAIAALAGVPALEAQQAGDSEFRAQVAEVRDRQAIAETLQRYIRGIDRHDKELARSAFWPEARINLGTPRNLEDYVQHEEALLATYASHQHHVTGQTIDIQGSMAHVETYVFFLALPRDRSSDATGVATPGHPRVSEKTTLGSGRYFERWEKREGEWRILVREYTDDLAVQVDTLDICKMYGCLSRWDRNDLSYVRPLEPLTPEQRRARVEANKKTSSPGARP